MFHNEDRAFVASMAGYGMPMESIRRNALCASGVQQRNKSHSAVNIGVFSNQGAVRA